MAFQLTKFQEKVRAANGHYEWFRTSSLHNLMVLLRDYPARTRPDQDVAAVETWVGPQGTGGKQLDARFITVDADTRLSSFINDPANATAVFHWAACRVVFNRRGQMWSETAGRWMTYNHTTQSWG